MTVVKQCIVIGFIICVCSEIAYRFGVSMGYSAGVDKCTRDLMELQHELEQMLKEEP